MLRHVSRNSGDNHPAAQRRSNTCRLSANTRQGIYAVTPSGRFLASVNTRQAKDMIAMLQKALAKWDALSPAERTGTQPAIDPQTVRRFEQLRPIDGLVLHVYSRDLPRTKVTAGWRGEAWNQDHAWFRRDEMLAMVPAAEIGAVAAFPEAALLRMARVHLVDNVRGQTLSHADEHVVTKELVARTIKLDGDLQEIEFTGRVCIERSGTWATRGYGPKGEQRLGFAGQLLGGARFDRKQQRFVEWKLLAVGTRHGATEFNGRQDDFGPAPMGIAFDLQPEGAANVAPSMYWACGWK
jgi:hypothetical protein